VKVLVQHADTTEEYFPWYTIRYNSHKRYALLCKAHQLFGAYLPEVLEEPNDVNEVLVT
jgi:hypothetical protein